MNTLFASVLWSTNINIIFLELTRNKNLHLHFFKPAFNIKCFKRLKKRIRCVKLTLYAAYTAIQPVFKRFTQRDLCTRWTVKGSKGTVVNQALYSYYNNIIYLESSFIHSEHQITSGTQTQDTFNLETVNPDRVNPEKGIKSVCEVFTQTCTQEYELQISNLTKVRKSIPPPIRLTHFIRGRLFTSKRSSFAHWSSCSG